MSPWWLLLIIPAALGLGIVAGLYWLAWRIGRNL